MYSTFLFTLLLCIASIKILFVSGALEAEGIDAGGDIYRQITIRNNRLISKITSTEVPVNVIRNKCGGKITQAPSRIVKEYYFRFIKEEGEKCTWVVEAPEDHVIYVANLYYETSVYPYQEVPTVDTYYDAPVLNIYDGSVVNESNRLFRIGEAHLDNAVSTGRYLVIDLAHKNSETFSAQKLNLKLYFVKKSDVSNVTLNELFH